MSSDDIPHLHSIRICGVSCWRERRIDDFFFVLLPLPNPVLCLAKRLDVPAVGWGQTPVLGELAPKRFSAFPSQHFPAKAGQLFSENIFLTLTFVPP